ncbi:Peptide methionine sulfoxide reductase A5 [Orchesella cincta]|uniref:peptide-methionine (S)-S-oxide reductase n=1 Tax=Orchesella cincta TaxID=48709 RepID=A0A1D2MB40_ORCCI|nr:Peptide methionine sulfoxide reductase A5 [Orchesella cincta]
MGGCCSRKAKVDINKYSDFHQEDPPTPTNDCDKEFLPVTGENATFACGQFWNPQAQFSIDPGVIRTRVGYTTGKKMIPEFTDKFADHVAVVDIEFDPSKTSYEKLLDKFWHIHDPTMFNEKPFYTKILYHNIDQKHAAENWLMSLDRKLTKFNYKPPLKRVRTDIEPVKHIFLASMENQHHLLQQDEFLSQVVNCTTP